jgi:ribose transport system permease protein
MSENAPQPAAAPSPVSAPPLAYPRGYAIWRSMSRFAAVVVLDVILIVIFSSFEPRFHTIANVRYMLDSIALLWIVSMGMTFVVLGRGIDLSVGPMLALCGIILAKLVNGGVPVVLAIVLTLIAGAAIGAAVNGTLVGLVGLSFFVVTLASMEVIDGLVNVWTGAETVYITASAPLLTSIGLDHWAGLPVPVWIMFGVTIVAFVVLRFTYFGRDIYSVGGNPAASRLSGLNARRTIMLTYGISALGAAVGSVIFTGQLGAASPVVASNIALSSAAAVLLGGTSFLGGVGGVAGTAVGVLFIGILQNGLGIAGISTFWQEVFTGIVLISAVLIDRVGASSWVLRLRRGPAEQPTG